MGICGCEMMIECEIKTGQTAESIENTRREGGDGVGGKVQTRLKEEDCGRNGKNRYMRLF